MAQHLALIVDCDLIGPRYPGGGRRMGLTWSVALAREPASADAIVWNDDWRRLCLPWNWGTIAQASALARMDAGVAPAVDRPVLSNSRASADFRERLDAHVARLERGALAIEPWRAFLWDGAGERDQAAVSGVWIPSFLADVSRWPADLARAAQLSCIADFGVDAVTDGSGNAIDLWTCDIVAAPHINLPGRGIWRPDVAVATTALLASDRGTPAMIRWPYIGPAGEDLQIVAYVVPSLASRRRSDRGRLIDLETLWIRVPGIPRSQDPEDLAQAARERREHHWSGRDPIDAMAPLIAEGLDPVRIALDAVRVAKETLASAQGRAEVRRWALNAFIAATTSSAALAADGSSLAAQVAIASGADASRVVDAISAGEAGMRDEDDGAKWRAAVRSTLGDAVDAALQPSQLGASLNDDVAAIDALRADLEDEGALRRVILAIWTSILRPSSTDPGIASFLAAAPSVLADMKLRRRLLAGLAGSGIAKLLRLELWRGDESAGGSRTAFARAFAAFAWDRTGKLVPPRLADPMRPIVAELATRHALDVVMPPVPSAGELDPWQREIGDDSPTEVPHALVFPIDRVWGDERPQPAIATGPVPVASSDPASGIDDEDLLRRFAGVGVLLRQVDGSGDLLAPGPADFKPWRSLNIANVHMRGATAPLAVNLDRNWDDLVLELAHVPADLGFRDGVSHAVVSYDNAGLKAEETARSAVQAQGDDLTDTLSAPLLRFSLPRPRSGDTLPEIARLPSLRFGQVYEAAAFMALLAGALPAELHAPGDPAAFRDDAIDVRAPEYAVRRMRYLRRVRIGEPRLTSVSRVRQDARAAARPLADAFEAIGRPGGLDDETRHFDYFVDPRSRLGMLRPTREAGMDLLVVDTKALGASTALVAALVCIDASGRVDETLTVWRWRIVRGADGTVRLFEGDAAGELLSLSSTTDDDGLVDLLVDPPRGRFPLDGADDPERMHVVLRRSGAALAHAGVWPDGTIVHATVARLPLDRRRQDPSYVLRVGLEGEAGASVSFGRPTVRIDGRSHFADVATSVPLVLLGPSNDWAVRPSAELKLGLPTVDVNTWDRWVAMDEWRGNLAAGSLAERRVRHRVGVVTLHDDESERLRDSDEVIRSARLALDDPAIEAELLVELVPILAMRTGVRHRMRVAMPPPTATADDLDAVRVGELIVSVEHGGANATGMRAAGGRVMVTIRAGEIWELRAYSLIDARWFHKAPVGGTVGNAGRFPHLVREGLPSIEDGGRSFVLGAPARLRLEAIDNALPSADLLHRCLVPRFVGSEITVSWEAPPGVAGADIRRLANVGSISLLRQVWRWEGRPLALDAASASHLHFPFAASGPDRIDDPAGEVVAWERLAGWDRDPLDLHRRDVEVAVPPEVSNVFRSDCRGDPRAALSRFAAFARSRYASLQPQADIGVLTRRGVMESRRERQLSDAARDLDMPSAWRRLLLPCRWTDTVAKPAVRLVIPLTTGSDASADGPGLLVVIDQPWLEIGGLAEALEAEIPREVRDDDMMSIDLQAAGPDPIVTGSAFPAGAEIDLAIRGPIGHSFDPPDSKLRRFASTSFIVETRLRGDDTARAALRSLMQRSLIKLRVRRRLIAPAMSEGLGDRASDWVDTGWHQLLQDFAHFRWSPDTPRAAPGDAEIAVDAALEIVNIDERLAFRRKADGGRVVPWAAASEGHNRFAAWILLTRRIYDAAGRREPERYLGLVQWNWAEGRYDLIHGRMPDQNLASADLIARVVEVQYRDARYLGAEEGAAQSFATSAENWDLLFISDGEPAAADRRRARIVRISPPIAGGTGPKAGSG